MNSVRITLILLFIATMLIMPSTVLAVALPDTIQINQVDVYQGVIDSADQLYIITYDLEYTTPPTGLDSEDLFLIRLMDATNQQLGVTVPVAYNNDGFDTGVAGIYFSAGDVDNLSLTFGPGNGYYMQLIGNPMIPWDGGTPPFENKVTFANYYTDDIQDTLHTRLSVITNIIQNDWGIGNLIEGPSGEQTLTEIGEQYMTRAILNLRTLNPQLFQAATSRPSYTDTEVISDFYVGGDSASTVANGNTWLAQTFVASIDYEIDRVAIMANVSGIPSDVFVQVFSSSGSPTGAALTSGTISASEFLVSPALDWEETAVTPVDLSSGDEYAIVISCTSGTLNWRLDPSSTYNGNALVSGNAGTTWGNIANSTFMFQTKAKGADSLSYLRRLEHQLDGTVFDTGEVSEQYMGMSGAWIRSFLWMGIAILIGAGIGYETNNPKPIAPVFFWIVASGYFISMIDPFVALGFATIGGLMTIYMTLFNRAST